jgi:hypothetical protein
VLAGIQEENKDHESVDMDDIMEPRPTETRHRDESQTEETTFNNDW